MGQTILRDLLVIFAVAIPMVLLAHRLRFPSIVGFLVTGFLIGPHLLKLIPDMERIGVMAEVGAALLLFSIGLEFSFERLRGWKRQLFGIGTLQVAVTAAVGTGAGLFFGWSFAESVFLGCAIALSSTAVVLAILSHRRWFDAPAGRIVTGILILQDLAVIPMMVGLKFVALPDGGEEHMVAAAVIKVAVLASALFVLYRWVLEPVLHYIAKPRSKELFVVVVIGLAVGAAYATEKMGLSFALGAFLGGMLVSTTTYRFHALSEIAPFRYCLNGLFFVSVGMMVNPVFVVEHGLGVFLLVLFILLLKGLIVGGAIVAFGYPVSVAAIGAIMLAQVGEFSFIVTLFGWKAGVIGVDAYQYIVDAAAITMLIAPFLVSVAPRIGEKLSFVTWRVKALRGKWQAVVPDEAEPMLAGHAVICGFGPLGMTVGKLLERRGMPFVVLELNPATAARVKAGGYRVYVGDGASGALLHHSGIENARLLAIAVPDQLNALAIVSQARRMNEKLYIVTRSRYRDQCQSLYDAGADVVVCEELEGGIEMGRYIMQELGMAPDEISSLFSEIRSFGSADFF